MALPIRGDPTLDELSCTTHKTNKQVERLITPNIIHNAAWQITLNYDNIIKTAEF